jgi:hypothetical protein
MRDLLTYLLEWRMAFLPLFSTIFTSLFESASAGGAALVIGQGTSGLITSLVGAPVLLLGSVGGVTRDAALGETVAITIE